MPCRRAATLREQRMHQMEQRFKAGPLWQGRLHDLVFAMLLGTPLHPSNGNRYFNLLVARAGVPPIPFHGLRHTHATLMLTHAIHPKVATERLGHAGIAITLQTYSHVVPGLQREAADIVGQVLTQKAKSV